MDAEENTCAADHRLFELAPVGDIIYTGAGEILRANRAFCDLVGTQAQGENLRELVLPEYRERLDSMMNCVTRDGGTVSAEVALRGAQGILFALLTSNCAGDARLRSAVTDITALKHQQNLLLHESLHDAMTGIYNRRFYGRMLRAQDRVENLPLTVAMVDIDGLKIINDALGHSFGDRAIVKVCEALKESVREQDVLIRTGGDEMVVLFPHAEPGAARICLRRARERAGECRLAGIPLTFSWGISTKYEQSEEIGAVIAVAEDMMYSRKLLYSARKKSNTVDLVSEALFARNPKLARHCRRVSARMAAFARHLGLEPAQCALLRQLGLLHDIGMASVSDEVLNKKTALSAAEERELCRHPEVGYRILSAAPGLEELARQTLFHHEHWDGSGYPNSICGAEIPYEARVLAVVDTCDRLRFGQYGRAGVCGAALRAALEQERGRRLDPALTDCFLRWCAQTTPYESSSAASASAI